MIEEKRTFICDLCGDRVVDLIPNLAPPSGWLVMPIKSKEGKPGKPPTIKRVLGPECSAKVVNLALGDKKAPQPSSPQ